MYMSFDFFNRNLLGGQLQNVAVNSFIPPLAVYNKSFICSLFSDSFMVTNPGDSIEMYSYGDQYYNLFIQQQPMTIDEYTNALNQFKQFLFRQNPNITVSFRSVPDLYNDYVSTMKILPMSAMVSVTESTYESITIDFNEIMIKIPTIYGIKLSMPDFIKMFRIYLPTVVLTVSVANKLYERYLDLGKMNDPNIPISTNGLVAFNNLNDLCQTMDQIINNFFKRDLSKEEITSIVTDGIINPELINYYNYMLQNFKIPESISRQALVLGRGARLQQFEALKEDFGIKNVDPSRPILLNDKGSRKIVVDYGSINNMTQSQIFSVF